LREGQKARDLRKAFYFPLVALLLGAGCGSGEYDDQAAKHNGLVDASDAANTLAPNGQKHGLAASELDAAAAADSDGGAATADSAADSSVADVADVTTDEAAVDAGSMEDASIATAEAGPGDAAVDGDACSGNVCGFDAGHNVCPMIDMYVINPTNVFVGENVHLVVHATDVEGDTIYYRWSAGQGSFDDPSAQKTDYRCSQAGVSRLTLTVSDGNCSGAIDFIVVDIVCHN
jgi:hypothetical protein